MRSSQQRPSLDPAQAGARAAAPIRGGVFARPVLATDQAELSSQLCDSVTKGRSWTAVVAESRDYLPGNRRAREVADSAISQLAKPYNSDRACELTLAALVLIIESHRRESKVSRKMLNDLTTFAQSVVSLRDARG